MRWRQKSTSSSVLWVPCLWLLISSIRGHIYPGTGESDYIPYVMIMSVLMILGGVILLIGTFDFSAFMKENKLVVILYCLMGASILWSSYHWNSLKSWAKTIGSLEMVLIILSGPDPLARFSFVIRRLFYLLIPLSLILIFFFPSFGLRVYPDGTSWVGAFENRNALAMSAMIFSLYLAWEITRKKPEKNNILDCSLLLLSLVVLVGSGSRTSLLGFLLGLVAFFLIGLSNYSGNVRNTGVTILYIIATAITFLFLIGNLLSNDPVVARILELLGRDLTLSGRTGLWSTLLEIGLKRPLLGYGLGGFWTEGNPLLVNNIWEKHQYFPMQAHNGYLGVFLEMGIFGLVVLLLVICGSYIKISRLFVTDYESARLRMAFFLAIIFHNICEASLCNENHSLWLWFLFSAAALPLEFPLFRRRFSPATGGDKWSPAPVNSSLAPYGP